MVADIEEHAAAIAVGHKAEGDTRGGRGVAEELHRLGDGGRIGLGHKVDAERLVGQHTRYGTRGAACGRAVEVERRARRDASARIGNTQQLEVVVFVKVVACNGLVEAELDVVGHAEHTVGRFGLTKDAWTARVLHAAHHLAAATDEARAMTAEADSA